MTEAKYRIGLIGFGAIGKKVVEAINDDLVNAAEVVAILIMHLTRHMEDVADLKARNILLTDDAAAFFNCCPDLIVEAAGQEAVKQYGQQILQSGTSLMISSIGAFTDDDLYQRMRIAAADNSAALYLVGGALPGAGWMQAASITGVDEVKITQQKPVSSWKSTPAEDLVDLKAIQSPVCFFEGSAREAAGLFKKSSNITAMLALSTIGMDLVQVNLVADPESTMMQTKVEFRGSAGELTLLWKGIPSPSNPSTSQDVPLNVIKAIRNICSPVKLGV